MRVKRRVLSPPAAINSTIQIILLRITSFATRTMIRHTHELIDHLGREHMIAKVRERFWIPQIRKAVCSVLSQCIVCKKFHAKPMTQQMAPYPKSRLMAYQPSFSFCGLELFGPLYAKLGGRTGKRWCCLLMCRKTSAVQLALVPSMDIDDFRMCFRRFVNRRGKVVQLRRDRGTNLWLVKES